MNGNEVVIDVKHLTKTYCLYEKPWHRVKEIFSLSHKTYARNYDALSDVSFQVRKGETLGIIGKNGAGKSTLLKMLTGVTTPTYGEIKIKGEISALLELGTGFNPEYNGYENIYLNGSMRGFSRAEMSDKVEEIISFADIGEYIAQPIKTYSSGMYSKLAFSITCNLETDIILVDEVLSVGDEGFQRKSLAKMESLIEDKDRTVIIVSHSIETLEKLCDRVMWLHEGRIMEIGEPGRVLGQYQEFMISGEYKR